MWEEWFVPRSEEEQGAGDPRHAGQEGALHPPGPVQDRHQELCQVYHRAWGECSQSYSDHSQTRVTEDFDRISYF